MKIDGIYLDWLRSLDLKRTRLIRFPSFLLLCGGEISSKEGVFKSCRNMFVNHIKTNNCPFYEQVILAEDIFQYFRHTAYKDLLRFEQDLAELATLTIIFSESPGSIAELGSFAVLKGIQDHLLVVMHEEDAENESFIWRGPASYLKGRAEENSRTNPIAVYCWPKKFDGGETPIMMDDFSGAADLQSIIEETIAKEPKTRQFDLGHDGHGMLLILDMLKVVSLATTDEIMSLLNFLEFRLDRRTIEQRLSLLVSLNLAVSKKYGNNNFFLSGNHEPWVSWAYAETASIRDAERWQTLFEDHYRRKEHRKADALHSYMTSRKNV